MADEIEIELSEDSPYANGAIDVFEDGSMYLVRDADSYYVPQIGDQKHTIVEGETPSSLAKRFYNNAKYWHLIEKANPGIDIFRYEAGLELLIPNPDLYK